MRFLTGKLQRVLRIQARRAANAVAKRAPEQRRETGYGPYSIVFPSRSIIGRAVAEGIVWDAHLLDVVQELPEQAVVCEVGSNIGASLLTMASARDDLRFICFEPSPRFLPYLQENVSRNALAQRVTVEPVFVGPASSEWSLTSNESTASAVVRRYDSHIPLQTASMRAVALDDYFSDRAPPAFLKIDTDGFEAKVLNSARALLRDYRPTLFVEYTPALLERAGDSADALRQSLLDAGYSRVDIYAGEGELLERGRALDLPIETNDYFDLVLRR